MRMHELIALLLFTMSIAISERLLASDETEPDTTASALSAERELKSVGKGVTKAIFPGVIVHGAGNFYAESYVLGLSLLATEIAGILMIKIAYNSYKHSYLKWGLFDWDSDDRAKYNTWMGIGTGLLIASWIVDIITTPTMVGKYNRRLKEEGLSLAIEAGGRGGDLIAVGASFAF